MDSLVMGVKILKYWQQFKVNDILFESDFRKKQMEMLK